MGKGAAALLVAIGVLAVAVAVAVPDLRVFAIGAYGLVLAMAVLAMRAGRRRHRRAARSSGQTQPAAGSQWDELLRSSAGKEWAEPRVGDLSGPPPDPAPKFGLSGPVVPQTPRHAAPTPKSDLAPRTPVQPVAGAPSGAGVEALVAQIRAEVKASTERMAREVRDLRDQLAASLLDVPANAKQTTEEIAQLRDQLGRAVAEAPANAKQTTQEIAQLGSQLGRAVVDVPASVTAEQEKFHAQLLEDQRSMVDNLVASLRAERDAIVGEVRGEVHNVREQLQAAAQNEIAKLVTEQAQFEQRLIDCQRELVAEAVGPLKAERDAIVGQVRGEVHNVREQLKAAAQKEIAKLGTEQEQFEQRLIERQRELVAEAVRPVKAESNAVVGQVRRENNSLRDQLKTFVQEEMAKLSGEQQKLIDRQSERLNQVIAPLLAEDDDTVAAIRKENRELAEQVTSVQSGLAKLADDQKRFRARLVAAAGVAEARFAEFTERVNARFDELGDAEKVAKAVADGAASLSTRTTQDFNRTLKRLWKESERALTDTREQAYARLDELARALERTTAEQDALEATLAAVQKEVARMARQKALGPTPKVEPKRSPAVRKAPAAKTAPAKKPPVAAKKSSATRVRAPAASAKRPRRST